MLSSTTHAPPLRVLLVEDSLVNQRLLVGLLHLRIYCVTVATDGQQAVDRMAEEEFDVVLMDVQMPVMDGLAATRLIRQQEAGTTKHTPILAVTAGMDRQSCLETRWMICGSGVTTCLVVAPTGTRLRYPRQMFRLF